MREISPDLEGFIPHYLHLLSIPSGEHHLPETLQGETLRRALEEALAAIVTLTSQAKPLVMVLEDWHWTDEASDSALKNLTGLVAHYPLLLAVTYRPEYERAWSTPENYTPIVVKPLDVADTEVMVRAVLAVDTLPEGLGERIHERTGGNALFNEEVARSLLEEGAVVVTDGQAELAGSVEELHLPDTIHAVIRARVDRLDPDAREVLRLASVIGREFTRAVLERLYPAAERLAAGLETLARQDLVHQMRVVPQAEYLFKHVLTQVVVYETLLLQQRKELHAQVGQAIETLYPDRLEEHYETLVS